MSFEVSGMVVSYSEFIMIEKMMIVVGVIGVRMNYVVIRVWFR